MTLASPKRALIPDNDQLGRYRLVATLGQGGMGTVHLAFACGLGQFRKLLVVKELRQDLTSKEGFISMFMDEARLAARLEHPNVVQTFEVDQEADRYFLAMQYLDGQPLSVLLDRLRASGSLSLDVHLQILCEVLAGLHYAHELRDYDGSPLHVVHRDISPQNIFITYHGQVKIVDFGVAKAGDTQSPTQPGIFKGKFAYAAPEQVMGGSVDGRTDVFSVGIMLWQAIARRRFSIQQPTPESYRARLNGDEPRIALIVPDVNPILAAICDQALSVDPDDRFPSAQAFRDDLMEYLQVCDARVESAQIGELMRRTFAAERTNMHRLIAQAMKNEDASASMVASLPFLSSDRASSSEVGSSTLADLGRQIDDAQQRHSQLQLRIPPTRPPPTAAPVHAEITQRSSVSTPPPARASHRRVLSVTIALIGMVGLCFVIWLAWAPEQRAISLPSAPAESGTARPATHGPSEAPAANEPPRGASAPTLPTLRASEPSAEPPAAHHRPLKASADSAPRKLSSIAVPADLSTERTEPRAARTAPKPRAAEAAGGARTKLDSATAAPPRATERRDPAREAAKRGDAEMGADLGALRGQRNLSIDEEDPYR
jgi:eukaryotic-like serine/threonine-protein kinase